MRSLLQAGVHAALVFLPFLGLAQTLDEGIAQFGKGKFMEAKSVFESVLKADEKNAEAHYRLGLILLMRRYRDDDQAVEHMEQAAELNPANADYQYGLGAAYGMKAQNAGMLKQAFLAPKVKKAFEKAVAINPRLIDAHIGLAQYYWRAPGIMGGDMEKAWSEADQVIALDEIRGRPFKAGIYMAEKKQAEAEREIATLTTNRSGEWRAWRAAGMFYWRNQMNDKAVSSFERYTVLRPDTADSYTFLARAYLQKKDGEKAIALAKKSLSVEKDFAPAIDVLAQAYELTGRKSEAREQYQHLLTLETAADHKANIEKKIKELQ